MSVLGDILDAIVVDHQVAALTISGNALTIVKRKLPTAEEGVDAAYQVTISGAEAVDKVKRIAFGQRFQVEYQIEMTLLVPSDRDQLTNLDAIAAWRETTRARYQGRNPLPGVTAVKRVEIDSGVFLDRADVANGFDFDQIVIRITTYENRST